MSSNLVELPLFPLNTVIFPGGVLPLRIFEPRYLDMVKDCMRNDHGFVIVLIKEGQEIESSVTTYQTGTICRISDWEQLPDGLLGITAMGESRIEIQSSRTESSLLLKGRVLILDENDDVEIPEEFEDMKELLQQIITKVGEPYSSLPARYEYAGWIGGRLTELMPLNLSLKQRLLEIDDHLVRLYHLKEALQESKFI